MFTRHILKWMTSSDSAEKCHKYWIPFDLQAHCLESNSHVSTGDLKMNLYPQDFQIFATQSNRRWCIGSGENYDIDFGDNTNVVFWEFPALGRMLARNTWGAQCWRVMSHFRLYYGTYREFPVRRTDQSNTTRDFDLHNSAGFRLKVCRIHAPVLRRGCS